MCSCSVAARLCVEMLPSDRVVVRPFVQKLPFRSCRVQPPAQAPSAVAAPVIAPAVLVCEEFIIDWHGKNALDNLQDPAASANGDGSSPPRGGASCHSCQSANTQLLSSVQPSVVSHLLTEGSRSLLDCEFFIFQFVQGPADSASASGNGSSRSRSGASCPFCGHGAHPAAGEVAESGAAGGGEPGPEAVPHVPQQVRLFGSSFVGESELPSPFQSYGSLSFWKVPLYLLCCMDFFGFFRNECTVPSNSVLGYRRVGYR